MTLTHPHMDQEQNDRIIQLIIQFLRDQATAQQLNELKEWRESKEENELWFSDFVQPATIQQRLRQSYSVDTKQAFKRTDVFIKQEHNKVLAIRRWSLVAAVILIIGGSIIFWPKSSNDWTKDSAKQLSTHRLEKSSIPPADKITLTLADNSIIVLDTLPNGVFNNQDVIQVKKEAGVLEYISQADNKASAALYNTLATPKGKQYRIVLPEGSTAWLNAASSLRFPLAYLTKERIVEMSGEVYIEVKKDKNSPFKVRVNGMEVTALGTIFNIKAYPDEGKIETILIEGKIKITDGNIDTTLEQPGQIATIDTVGRIIIGKVKDIKKAADWKNGNFYFEKDHITAAMREIQRWYGIDVHYIDTPSKFITYTGFKRSESLDSALSYFKKVDSNLNLIYSDNKVIISSKK